METPVNGLNQRKPEPELKTTTPRNHDNDPRHKYARIAETSRVSRKFEGRHPVSLIFLKVRTLFNRMG